ncbi:MAG: metal-sensing transcriptional repressor [Flexilinea flocculi]|jgi:DNA-binding FrmR family transcriptional regulator|nr:metal-sensing transcriptional repressor [Flexilinea flocculi]
MVADKKKILRLLKTARGQIDGLIKMVEEDRYCIEISNQLLASQAILRAADKEIIHAHLKGCVKDAFEKADETEKQQKIEEIIQIIDKMAK